MSGYAINKDVLSGKFIKGFQLIKGECFSEIIEVGEEPDFPKADAVIMNPPYSLKYKWDEKMEDARFSGYMYPPPNFADYGFVLHGLYHLNENGRLVAVLANGVLFRGGREKSIRQALVQNNLISEVVALPEKLFLNTAIPVCIIVLRHGADNGVLFINAEKECEKRSKQNRMNRENIERILHAELERTGVDKFSRLVSFSEIQDNDFNLNIPRYVNSYEHKPAPPLKETLMELEKIESEITEVSEELYCMLGELTGSVSDMEAVERHRRLLKRQKRNKQIYDQMALFD